MECRLAAIIAADVVGYSRLMGTDEAGTFERLKAFRKDLVQPKITERGGRIVKLMGDGFLAVFPSVVDAVQCAVDIQQEITAWEPDIPDDRRITLRCPSSKYLRLMSVFNKRDSGSSLVSI